VWCGSSPWRERRVGTREVERRKCASLPTVRLDAAVMRAGAGNTPSSASPARPATMHNSSPLTPVWAHVLFYRHRRLRTMVAGPNPMWSHGRHVAVMRVDVKPIDVAS
jgi:hypothetical protein